MKHKFQHVDNNDNHHVKTVSVITTFQTHQDNYDTFKKFLVLSDSNRHSIHPHLQGVVVMYPVHHVLKQ